MECSLPRHGLAPLVEIRKLSFHVALAVDKRAQAEGLADPLADEALAAAVRAKMWEPFYTPYRRLRCLFLPVTVNPTTSPAHRHMDEN